MNLTIIQKSIDYIEDNLKNDIKAKELSEMAGFSMFHYYRLFQSAVGLPVMQYITRRRLLNALYDMHSGEKMITVALDYGFETQAGFYKAFVREFGYTPTEFLNMSKKKKPYRIDLFREEHIMVSHKKIKEALQNWGYEDNTDKLNQWIMIYKNILYGYDKVVKLTDNEWKAIPFVVITNQLISTAWFSEQEKYRELYETNKKMTDWMLHKFYDMIFE